MWKANRDFALTVFFPTIIMKIRDKGKPFEIISDSGSGINYKKEKRTSGTDETYLSKSG